MESTAPPAGHVWYGLRATLTWLPVSGTCNITDGVTQHCLTVAISHGVGRLGAHLAAFAAIVRIIPDGNALSAT